MASTTAFAHRPHKATPMPSRTHFHAKLLSILLLSLAAILLLHRPPTVAPPCTSSPAGRWSGDLRHAEFSWNSLPFSNARPPPLSLKIAVFSRKWPVASAPGGMERHALTLHSALALRGHRVHVFTSAPPPGERGNKDGGPKLHFLDGPPGQWRCDEAWAMFEAEGAREPFDVVHSESVAVFHRFARGVPNLVVSWHGIALEALQSGIYQDLTRGPHEPMAPAFNKSLAQAIYKVLDEVRFFQSYAHHVATSDSTGEMLRDVYQLPLGRVHVILNGVDEERFGPDRTLGAAFREEVGLPEDARLVMGASGRLVKDKGHPLLHEAFAKLVAEHPGVYLLVAGTGPWAQRYVDMGGNVVVLGAVPPGKLKAFYNALDVFLNPTLRPQGLDQTLLEAMQCGTPVAATRLPSIKGSVVVDQEYGFTFAPNAAALQEVLETMVHEGPARLAQRGRACRRYAASMFAARKMAMAYERLFLCVKNQSFCQYPLDFD